MATEADSVFFNISPSDVVSKWLGESEKLVKELFQQARDSRPAIIFIDEVDSLCSARSEKEHDATRRIKNQLLGQMDGVGANNDGILVLGATNIPWALDEAFRRRFQKRVYIPLPDKLARKRMFEIYVGKTRHDLQPADYDVLAEKTEGYSGADIKIVVQDALMLPIHKASHFKQVSGPSPTDPSTQVDDLWTPCDSQDPSAVQMPLSKVPAGKLVVPNVRLPHFLEAIRKNCPTVGDEHLKRFEDFTAQFGQEG